MTNHQKRLSVPKSWPVERKTDTFTVKAGAGPHGEDGVPLLILLRDVLGHVDSRKEARYALSQDAILVNGQPVNDEGRPIGMFDIIALEGLEEYYRVFPDEGGRLALTPIDADAADSRLGKVEDKRQVKGGDTQLSLHDGTNVTVDSEEYGAKDSVVIDNENKEIVAHFPYEEGALVTAVRGNHAGKIGEIASIDVTLGSGSNTVTVETDDGEFETIEEYVVVIDENFVGGEDDE
ncbi:30S ribosomal protein S4e [Natribaculum luteum]|uniref:Small ribosomal subunit protein eS4 n=1 Tax=Natribaculum luteum TaxID=1586232 RepID=A0ABD5P554_9EURY|nr:30S ribosomal protein S4e [Natribaculum luteum]